MNNVKRYARRLELLSMALVPLAFCFLLLKWFFCKIPADGNFCNTYLRVAYDFDAVQLPFLFRFFGIMIDGVGLGLLCYGIMLFIKSLRFFQRGEFFSLHTTILFKRISKVLLCWAVYSPLSKTLSTLVITATNAPGHRVLAITFGHDDLLNIFMFAFLVMITSLMHEAYQLKAEQDLTI